MNIFATEKPEYAESIEQCIQTLEINQDYSIQFFAKDKNDNDIQLEFVTIAGFLAAIAKLGTEYFEAYFYILPF